MTAERATQVDPIVPGSLQRLYILDYGLFQVHENGRIIGIPGYLLQTDEGVNILVDTGFPARYATDPGGASAEDGLGSFGQVVSLGEENLPAGQLALVGLTTADIQVLIMTHTDIDHVGGIADFPQAAIVIGQAERELPKPRYFNDRSPIAWPQDVDYRLVHANTRLCSGAELLLTPGHSPGHLSLLLDLPETGAVLLTGDAISRPAEIEEGFTGAWDPQAAAASAVRLMTIAEREEALVIYGHDPQGWNTLRKAPRYYA